MPSRYEDQIFHRLPFQSVDLLLWRSKYFTGYPSSQLISCYEDQVFHWLPLQSVHLLLWRSSISLATPPVSSSPAMKIKYFTGYPSSQFISSAKVQPCSQFYANTDLQQPDYILGRRVGWGRWFKQNKTTRIMWPNHKKHTSRTTQPTPNPKYFVHSCNKIIHSTAQVLNLHQSYFWFSRSLQLTNPTL